MIDSQSEAVDDTRRDSGAVDDMIVPSTPPLLPGAEPRLLARTLATVAPAARAAQAPRAVEVLVVKVATFDSTPHIPTKYLPPSRPRRVPRATTTYVPIPCSGRGRRVLEG